MATTSRKLRGAEAGQNRNSSLHSMLDRRTPEVEPTGEKEDNPKQATEGSKPFLSVIAVMGRTPSQGLAFNWMQIGEAGRQTDSQRGTSQSCTVAGWQPPRHLALPLESIAALPPGLTEHMISPELSAVQ
jgi:hypothetical protein